MSYYNKSLARTLASHFPARSMTRRTLLKAGGAALAAGALVGPLGIRSAVGSDPVRGGTLRYGSDTQPSGFDPAVWWNGYSWDGTNVAFNRLVTLHQDGSLSPELLSQHPEISADGKFYSYTLRKGIKFHHGREVTAEDVKFSLERLVNPATGSEGGGLYTGIQIPGMEDILNEKGNELTGIKIIDRYNFTIELESADSVFAVLLGLPFASIVPKDVVEDLGNAAFNWAPVGSGPYVMKDIDPSKGLVLERIPNYGIPEIGGYIDRVEFTIGIEPDLSILRIQKGEQDMLRGSVPSSWVARLQDDPGGAQYIQGATNNVIYITLSLDHPEMANRKVRQAISHAIDSERFVRALGGLGQVATGGLFSPLSPYFQEGLNYSYDVNRSKELLAEAGYADGFECTFWSCTQSPWNEQGQTVTQDLAQVGINVDLKTLLLEQWLAEIVKNPPGITNNQWQLPYPHGSYVMDGAFTKASIDAGCCNFSNYKSDYFDELVAAAHATSSFEEQVALYKEMDKIAVQDEILWIPMIYPEHATVLSSRVRGYYIPSDPGTNYFNEYWLEG